MTTPGDSTERNELVRRTRSVRRGVLAAGATGALGAAIAIGVSTQASGATDDNQAPSNEAPSNQAPDNQGFDQSPQSGQLAQPGSGGPAQGRSGGS